LPSCRGQNVAATVDANPTRKRGDMARQLGCRRSLIMLGPGRMAFLRPQRFLLSLKTPSVVRSTGASAAIVRANQWAAHSMNDKNTPINTLHRMQVRFATRATR